MNTHLKAAMVVLVAGCAMSGTVSAQPGPLKVVELAPRGELEEVRKPDIRVMFSHPIVPLGEAVERAEPPEWLELEPSVPARWRWANTSLLIGEPESDLTPATTFRITVRTDAVAVSGQRLEQPVTATFTSSRPAVAVTVPSRYDLDAQEPVSGWAWRQMVRRSASAEQLIRPDEAAILLWSQPVKKASLADRLRVEAVPHPLSGAEDLVPAEKIARWRDEDPDAFAAWQRFLLEAAGGEAGPVPFTLESADGGEGRVFLVRPAAPWPWATRLTVSVAAGVSALAGPAPSLAAHAGTLITPPPLAPLGFRGREMAEGALAPDNLALAFSTSVGWLAVAENMRFRQIGDEEWQRPELPEDHWMREWRSMRFEMGELGLAGNTAFEVCLEPGLQDSYGQVLGFPWCGVVRTGRYPVVFSLVEGDGVVEWDGPHRLPLRTRNVITYRLRQWRLSEEMLVPALRNPIIELGLEPDIDTTVPVEAVPDRFALRPVELAPALQGRPGVIVSRLDLGEVVPDTGDEVYPWRAREGFSAVSQVTALGLTVKASTQEGLLVWVTRLREAAPAAGVDVAVRDSENQVLWRGKTDADGLVSTPADVSLGNAFLVTARDGDDLAYARTQWWEGHRGWEFNLPVDYNPDPPVLAAVWSDRGVVRPGESLHLKGVLRRQRDRRLEHTGLREVTFVVRDSRGDDVVVETASLDPWGAAEIQMRVPPAASLGRWDILLGAEYDSERRSFSGESMDASGSFRVAEFRRPKFRVLVSAAPDTLVAGDTLAATVEGRLLAGGGMAGARTRWSVRARTRAWSPPGRRWAGWEVLPRAFVDPWQRPETRLVASGEGELNPGGELAVQLPNLEGYQGWPQDVEVEAEVEDVDRQTGAGTTRLLLLPGEFLVGVEEPSLFQVTGQPLTVKVAALRPDGEPLPDVPLTVELRRRHWESVRRREVSGRYLFESRAVVNSLATQEVVSALQPVNAVFDLEEGGEYAVVVSARDARGNQLEAGASFYVLGGDFTPWRMDQENRMDLVPERDSYAPGEIARVLVKSPWEQATALVTVERAGVLERWVKELTGTMAVVEIPIREEYTPNVFVSVVALRGRVDAAEDPELVDPGRPAYRVGYCELPVPPRHRRLSVGVASARPEYRPGEEAEITVMVGGAGGPRRAGVTVWAVDAGVLELTGYRTPDPMDVFYARRGLGITTSESRSRLIGRRSYGTKADAAGGGGGREDEGEQVRRDFRALAVWQGDVVTDGSGRATIRFPLPDSLTTYRVMAVAVAGQEEFGAGQTEILVSKRLGIEPALPRFLRPGDRARVGVVVRNRTGADAEVEVKAIPDADGPVRLRGGDVRVVRVPAGASREVGFGLDAHTPGMARLTFAAVTDGRPPERDAFETELPVLPILPVETTAAFFSVVESATEHVAVPRGVFPNVGGLELRLASSALVGARPAINWLAEYPHACAEQVASQVLGLTAAGRLGAGFAPEDVAGKPMEEWLDGAVTRLAACQRPDGGFAFWPGGNWSSPVLSAHVVWALSAAAEAGARIPERVRARAAEYLARHLREQPAGTDGAQWLDQVLAAFALSRIGSGEPAFLQVLFDGRRPAGPMWGRAVLAHTMLAANPSDARAATLLQEVRNSVAREGRTAHLAEPVPAWGWRIWWGAGRGTAATLLAELALDHGGALVLPLTREVLDRLTRDAGRTTQEAAWMLQALAAAGDAEAARDGSRRAEARLAGRRVLTTQFAAGERREEGVEVAMAELQRQAARAPEKPLALEVKVTGQGNVYGSALLRTAPSDPDRPGRSLGMEVERRLVDEAGEVHATVAAGDELMLEVTVCVPAIRRFVAVVVPLPAGVEPVDPDLATTARRLREDAGEVRDESRWYRRPGFDHVELRDDRVLLYATVLEPGEHTFRVPCRATTSGTFHMAPARAEEMYAPEVFGTTSPATLEVRR